jgi:hypothetical protein
MIDPRFAAEHNITEEEEILSQVTMLFGEVPMELVKAGTRGNQFYANNDDMPTSTVRVISNPFYPREVICRHDRSDRLQPPQAP